jgi:hypothetical protein
MRAIAERAKQCHKTMPQHTQQPYIKRTDAAIKPSSVIKEKLEEK